MLMSFNFNKKTITTLIEFSKNFLLTAISIMISIFISEIIFRIIKIDNSTQNVMNINEKNLLILSANKRLIYTYKKNIPGKTNSYGFHDKEYALEKKTNKTRILALGDSVTYGTGDKISINENFLSLLEEEYNNIEIINLSHDGYNTMQEVEHFQLYGLQFKPDIVWVFYVLNDPENESMELYLLGKEIMVLRKRLELMTLLGWLNHYSYIWKYLSNKYFNESLKYKIYLKTVHDIENQYNNKKFKNLYQYMHQDKYFNNVKKEFIHLKKLSLENKFKLVVFIVPVLVPYKKYDNMSLHKKVSDALKEIEIEVVDLLPIIINNDPNKMRLNPNDILHLNKNGHKIIKDHLKPILETEIKSLSK